MSARKKVVVPLNRVEGDLKVHLEYDGNKIYDAFSAGTMYRGFENIMKERGPLDGLVITPRICGICTTSHLYAAAKALDMISQAVVPDNATRVRNITLIAEQLQNDVRHHTMQFMVDATNPVYENAPFYEEAIERYTPIRGSSIVSAIQSTKRVLEIVSILGGQWPHSSFMVPGGVVSVPGANDIMQCKYVLRRFKSWYEKQILGCTCEEWNQVQSARDLEDWLESSPSRYSSDLGFYLRFGREAGLDRLGKGTENFISYGFLDMPRKTGVKSLGSTGYYFPAGFVSSGMVRQVNQHEIKEDISHSWFTNDETELHPYEGVTIPYATGSEGRRYSWAKAPRYDGHPAETGPLAQMMALQHPLFTNMVNQSAPSVFSRQLARIVRPALTISVMDQWLDEIAETDEPFFTPYNDIKNGQGHGMVEAPRGSLGHWVIIEDGRIKRYQVISPTTWNASPRDANGQLGPWERALAGTAIKNPNAPIEVDHIVRSFDPCLVCTVHCADLRWEV
ncbi:Regulatory H2-sensing hydrogenase, HupV [Desulfatibacillum aliphaticivorans]|uniref:Regulatory H2-sensing hydrogenase, HupV n=1 Tax=Desulfatibacillum aliphaticivorans TaxID=218208 RepID=B8FII4_DESAL|nr:nickel-dependent hydrogenase large subunit [Desulfatibacillum aliphaticivorans]ACL03974.1 Regulatory H2-sensing hydrogenase, HupV [Desulfatibacillum aliphaticivorans]